MDVLLPILLFSFILGTPIALATIFGASDESNFYDPNYDFYSCHMENQYIRTCFIFRAKTEEELVAKIKWQEAYGWYYDGYLRRIDMRRAKELIDVGAKVVH